MKLRCGGIGRHGGCGDIFGVNGGSQTYTSVAPSGTFKDSDAGSSPATATKELEG